MNLEHNQQIKIIEEIFQTSAEDGAFSNLWYYIRDIKNVRIEFGLEITDYSENENGDTEYLVIGELYKEGFKDRFGDYYLLQELSNSQANEPKYILNSSKVFSNKNILYGFETGDLEGYDYLIRPNNRFVFDKNEYEIPFDFIPKFTESLLLVTLGDKPFMSFINDVSKQLLIVENDDEEIPNEIFNACLSISVIYEFSNLPVVKLDLIYIIEEGYIDQIYPVVDSKQLNDILNVFLKGDYILTDTSSLPKTIIDSLGEIQNLISNKAPLTTIFKEYYTILEIYMSELYSKYYDDILLFEKSVTNESDRKIYDLDNIKKFGEKYQPTNFRKINSLLSILAHGKMNTFSTDTKYEIKNNLIPLIEIFGWISQVRNQLTHSTAPNYLDDLLKTGILVLKDFIGKLSKIQK